MPCNSDHLKPTHREEESIRVCRCLVYVLEVTKQKVPQWAKKAVASCYGNVDKLDEATKMLCELCKKLDDDIIYNGRKKRARELADWWDEHEKADRKRKQTKSNFKKGNKLRASGLKKLNEQERIALGLIED